ncbi:hypothetical protein LJC74_05580 [Eubacteriales bacterium OttesenSCG-928-A19]|nr:hypothetical protein [Eubacteriales bacterium OttesenSCG-928-A19]
MSKRKVTFPHFANYCVPVEYLVTNGLDLDYVVPPPMTKHTLELGSRYSPDYACAPFKIHLGCYLEAIEKGADTLLQVSGACRLGYYGELHEQIIRDLGHEVDFFNMAKVELKKPKTVLQTFSALNPHISLKRLSSTLVTTLRMVDHIDDAEDYIRRNVGFEREEGEFDAVYAEALKGMQLVETPKEMRYVARHQMKQLKAVPVSKPKNPLRVGVVGEYYSIMDPFSSHDIEREMAKMGVMVERWMNVTNSLFHYGEKDMLGRIRGYSKYNMGATAMSTVERALKFARKGYDGIIHIKSFGCTPEMDAMPVLQNISADYKIPILYFSFDSQTADTGIQTRLEAFYDMITMRKGKKA